MSQKLTDPASLSRAALQAMQGHEKTRAFALIDGALLNNFSSSVQKKWLHLTKHSLLNQAGVGAVEVGPLLMELSRKQLEANFAEGLFERASGHCAVSLIVTEADAAQVVGALSALVDVHLSDGSEMVMRFFDPRVLPFWLEILEPRYREQLAIVISQWVFWDAEFEPQLVSFARGEQHEIAQELPMKLSPDQEAHLMNSTYPFTMIERFRSEDQGALDRIPVPQRYAFFKSQIARANGHGLESQGEVEAYCGTAIDVGPKFDEDAAMTPAWLGVKAGQPYHEAIADVADADWQRMRGVK